MTEVHDELALAFCVTRMQLGYIEKRIVNVIKLSVRSYT